MKIPYTVFRTMFLCALAATALSACLKENRDECDEQTPARTTVRVVVTTYPETIRSSAGSYDIQDVALYVFNEDHTLVTTWTGDTYTYGQRYVAELDLDPATYHFVVWTNQQMMVYGPTVPTYGPDSHAGELIVGLNNTYGDPVTDLLPDLHHGILSDARVIEERDNEFIIVLRPNTYIINYIVEGLPETSDTFRFTVTDNNSHYTYDNTIIESSPMFDYVSEAAFEEGGLSSSMKVLKLAEDRSPKFVFMNITDGRELYRDDLIVMIKKAYENSEPGTVLDFDKIYEFEIKIIFDAEMNVSIKVNGWDYNKNGIIIG